MEEEFFQRDWGFTCCGTRFLGNVTKELSELGEQGIIIRVAVVKAEVGEIGSGCCNCLERFISLRCVDFGQPKPPQLLECRGCSHLQRDQVSVLSLNNKVHELWEVDMR